MREKGSNGKFGQRRESTLIQNISFCNFNIEKIVFILTFKDKYYFFQRTYKEIAIYYKQELSDDDPSVSLDFAAKVALLQKKLSKKN